MAAGLQRFAGPLPRFPATEMIEIEARWARTPVLEVFSTPLPREALPALEDFLGSVGGMDRGRWERFAASGGVSPLSASTDEANLAMLRTGERTSGIFFHNAADLARAEHTARTVEAAGLVATRHRTSFRGLPGATVAATSDAARGEALVRTHAAVDGIERDIALGSMLGYDPRDIAYYVDRRVGYEGVRYLLGT